MNQEHGHLSLQLPAQAIYLPVVIPFVEAAAGAFGLEKDGALRLGLATEEIFAYLSNRVCGGAPLEIRCVNGIFYTRVEFRFSVSDLNMGALNMTASASCAGDDDLAEMGLVIAARTIDRLNIIAERHQRVCLVIEKDKDYPPAPEMVFPQPDVAGDLIVEEPGTEDMKRFVMQTAKGNAGSLCPTFFHHPGKVVDMVAGGEYRALVALTPKRDMAGGMLLFSRNERIVEIIGPYAFSPNKETEITEQLLAYGLASIARTKTIALLSLTGLPASIQPQFEALGTMSYYQASGDITRRPVFYRLLHEDPGCLVWTDALLKNYLTQEYGQLYLAREIREVKDYGESRFGASIFSAEVKREFSEVVLRPLWPGADMADNVKNHLQCLAEEALLNIFFELDLGVAWHASLIPALMANRFKPALILPFAGQADKVVFQYHAAQS